MCQHGLDKKNDSMNSVFSGITKTFLLAAHGQFSEVRVIVNALMRKVLGKFKRSASSFL